MKKSGVQYAAEVRTLRANGFNFPASGGYTLANPSQWSTGQKSAVTRAFNSNKRSISARKGAATRQRNAAFAKRSAAAKKGAATRRRNAAPSTPVQRFTGGDIGGGGGGLTESEGLEFFDDAAGDNNEEFDDIEFFDFDEAEEFQDEHDDQYAEAT